jgi:cold shock protein
MKRRVTDPAELREINQMLAQSSRHLFEAVSIMQPFAEDKELARHLAALQPPAQPERPVRRNQTMEIKGTVRFYDQVRGFGFLTPAGVADEDRDRHVYCHVAALRRSGLLSLKAGQHVAFELQSARKPGMKDEAAAIRILLNEAA